jgi:DNA invertase Pin-like site-specific DNA recombinase
MANGNYVSYLRVSTARQGRSGLGLEAQRKDVADFLDGGRWKLIGEHVEIESGRRKDRPELERALAMCRLRKATLVVARMDRLSRNASFLLRLQDSGAKFVAADVPFATDLTVGILAMVAQYEAEAISSRTKAALAAAKRRGVVLGNPAHLDQRARRLGTKASAKVRGAHADQDARDLAPILAELRAEGAVSLRGLAAGLNALGYTTPRGGAWGPGQVARVIARGKS